MAKSPLFKYEDPFVKYSDLAANRRGLIIEKTIQLEKVMDLRISYYFCKDESKREELDNLVLSNLNFASKIQILVTLYKQYSPEIFELHPRLEKDLEKIRKFRNELAHSWLDVTVTFVANRPKFKPAETQLIHKGKTLVYDEKRINELSTLILKYGHVIMNWLG